MGSVRTFMDLYRDGVIDGSAIDEFIDAWSDDERGQGPAFWSARLGMTPPEYVRWATDGTLPERGAP